MSKAKTEIQCILSLAFPSIIENVLQTLLGTTDTYFAGQLTDHAIAGIGVNCHGTWADRNLLCIFA